MDNDPNSEPTLFSAVMTPNRSLGQSGFVIVMLLVAGVSFIAGLVFLMAGAWPVTGIFGLDVALIYWAFRANYRAGRAYERIIVTPTELIFRKVSAKGAMTEWRCNPLWVRVERVVDEDFGVQKLHLVSRGESVPIASFLGPDEKESFGNALQAALAAARRGPDRNPALV
ncbi:putative membrane protein [Pseudorhodoplanes sinuspersici]|nr:putative membrane protein [Pseudorhodoplanes sinuspersici]